MKIRNGFVTNSSATSFVISLKKAWKKETFMSAVGADGISSVNWIFEELFEAIDLRKREIHGAITESGKGGLTVSEFLKKEGFDCETVETVEKLIAEGRTVYYGEMHSDGGNAEVYYKPVGIRIYEGLKDEEELDIFLKTAMTFEKCKIGFDSCMISWLVKHRELIVEESIDYCEAGRFSAFISEKGFMYPCSFLTGDDNVGDSIREKGLVEIWKNSMEFKNMREQLTYPARQRTPISKCMSCADYPLCHGGCQAFSINRCR